MPSQKKKATTSVSKAVKIVTPPELLYVEWLDAVVDDGWSETNEHRTHLCKSTGWIIKETEEEIVLAADISSDTLDVGKYQTNRRIAIPKAWIKLRKKVTLDRRKT